MYAGCVVASLLLLFASAVDAGDSSLVPGDAACCVKCEPVPRTYDAWLESHVRWVMRQKLSMCSEGLLQPDLRNTDDVRLLTVLAREFAADEDTFRDLYRSRLSRMGYKHRIALVDYTRTLVRLKLPGCSNALQPDLSRDDDMAAIFVLAREFAYDVDTFRGPETPAMSLPIVIVRVIGVMVISLGVGVLVMMVGSAVIDACRGR